MHRCRRYRRARGSGFPRTRGDAPAWRSSAALMSSVPPHARGCTREARPAGDDAAGSPARAGMHLLAIHVRREVIRFPRTRGDAPVAGEGRAGRDRVPPHARGCTRAQAERMLPAGGSPARAGMHPPYVSGPSPCSWFPRTRGDAPALAQGSGHVALVPPHARGCTGSTTGRSRPAPGSPARAGMHRWPAAARAGRAGFPRTRGDAPLSGLVIGIGHKVPPHARGCTRLLALRYVDLCGSPARAGMHPWDDSPVNAVGRFPRTRGDAPMTRKGRGKSGLVPPHARGCTPSESDLKARKIGSPARAGMHPHRGQQHAVALRFPRTRGDAPPICLLRVTDVWVPPHARGCIRRWLQAEADSVGSPARAGMHLSSCRWRRVR